MKRIIIAAPHSGAGKTTLTMGILAALRRRGLQVAPFKVGPDFIDPGHHRQVTGRPSINLDGWLCPPEFVLDTFARHSQDADLALVEGVMGLFDGLAATEQGSTAQIAKMLGAPVLLVVDGKGQSRSVAALIQGFARFDRQLHVAGVIFNNVASDSHAALLREVMLAECPDLPVLGVMPRDERLRIPSRHLGLVTAEENPLDDAMLTQLATVVEEHLDLDLIVNLASRTSLLPSPVTSVAEPSGNPVRIAVARDAAFCFVYEDNLRLLRQAGGELVEFSPLDDAELPAGCAGIYLPGGYPELFAGRLAANVTLKEGIYSAVAGNMPVYAECGGFIYLTRGLETQEGADGEGSGPDYPFVGIFPVWTRMLPRRKALGYREVELLDDTILGSPGMVARGHEFHYSEIAGMPLAVERVYRVRKNGQDLGAEGYCQQNCLASYIHLHFASCPGLAERFVAACRRYQIGRVDGVVPLNGGFSPCTPC